MERQKPQLQQQQQQAALENQRVAFAQEQHLMNQQLAEMLQQARWAELQAGQAQTQLSEAQDKLKTALDEKAELEKTLAELKAAHGGLLSQNEQLEAEKLKLTQDLEEKTQLLLRGKFSERAKEAELVKLQDQIKTQEAKIELLRSEKWELAQEKAQLQGNLDQLEKMFTKT